MINDKKGFRLIVSIKISMSLLILSLIFYLCVPAVSQTSSVNEEVSSQKYALDLLKNMSKNIEDLDQFGYHLDIIDEYDYDGVITHLEKTADLVIKREGGIFADIKDDYNHKRFWYNGEQITLLTVPANYYATAKVSGTMDEILDLLISKQNVTIPMADLLYSKPFDVLTEDIDEAYYAGLHRVGSTPCHHWVFIQENIDWQIWIEDGQLLLPRKVLITYKNEEGQPRQVVKINNWNMAPLTTQQAFDFVPPPGALEIVFLVNSK